MPARLVSLSLCSVITLGLVVSSPALAGGLPPWTDPGDLPLPEAAISTLAIRDEVPVHVGPNGSSARHGVIAPFVPLPLYGLKRGPGCSGRWVNIGPLSWVCQDKMQLSAQRPVAADDLVYDEVPDGLPFRYFFVGSAGAPAYARLQQVDGGSPEQMLEPGFAVAVVEERTRSGESYSRTTHGMWVPSKELTPVREVKFQGKMLAEGKLDFAWVVREGAPVLTKPAPLAKSSRKLSRFDLIAVLEEKKVGAATFVRFEEDAWVSAKDIQKPSLAAPPADVAPAERWIDVELGSQTLVAYEGARPVFATLVSTGKGAQGSPTATPVGEHRIWVKLVSSTMDNLEDEDAADYYSIEDVPYVQFFAGGAGLHAAFWHDKFGQVRSHGCVNLAPRDAQWLFGWTGPHLPAGWTAVMPTDLERGTVIRVR